MEWQTVLPRIRAALGNVRPENRRPSSAAGLAEFLQGNDVSGYAVRTLPHASGIRGFSGPTDTLLVFDSDRVLIHAEILNSEDTPEHSRQVTASPDFFPQFLGSTPEELARMSGFDAVSGATLTSAAIAESIRLRMAAALAQDARSAAESEDSAASTTVSLRFPDPPSAETASVCFPDAVSVTPDLNSGLWNVRGPQNELLGRLLRTTPTADSIVGYQGPTETLICLHPETDSVEGLIISASFDNEPYVTYVREDRYWRKDFQGRSLADIAAIDPTTERLEGVSGATMTSQCVIEGIIAAAAEQIRSAERQAAAGPDEPRSSEKPTPRLSWPEVSLRTLSTVGITIFGVVLGFGRLRGNRIVRRCFLFLVILWLGLINGDLVSQAALLGWAANGLPWKHAAGLIFLSGAAVLAAAAGGRNVYCTQICPHGAVQQLARNRIPSRFRIRTSGAFFRWLRVLPWLLLLVPAGSAMLYPGLNPADFEAFDAWLFPVASACSVVIAVVGLGFSLFVPMGYCRFGCPTGTLLNYLARARHGINAADAAMAAMVIIGCFLL